MRANIIPVYRGSNGPTSFLFGLLLIFAFVPALLVYAIVKTGIFLHEALNAIENNQYSKGIFVIAIGWAASELINMTIDSFKSGDMYTFTGGCIATILITLMYISIEKASSNSAK